jgi:D-alanine-D-alanine ligase
MKKTIAIIAGGDSGEYEISMKSGRVVYDFTDREKYIPYLIQIRGSDWFCEENSVKYPMNKDDFSLNIDGRKITFDCVFCAIHGTPGENGKIPAWLEMLGIPFTASDSLVSALTFHKYYGNCVVKDLGVLVPDSIFLRAENLPAESTILQQIGLPLFVKPNAGGSSVGMSKVKKPEDLLPAIERAFEQDKEVLTEQFISGRELTCGLIKHKGELITLPICEIKSKKEFFDFESKYDPLLAEEIVPADIPEKIEREIKNISATVYEKLNCRGVVRMDYIWHTEKQKIYFLELNTVPGLTRESIVPKMAMAYGINLTTLFSMMIEDALWRAESNK